MTLNSPHADWDITRSIAFTRYNNLYMSRRPSSLGKRMKRSDDAIERMYAEPKPEPHALTKTFGWRQPRYEKSAFSNRFHDFYLWDFVLVEQWRGDIRSVLQGYDDIYTSRNSTKKITPAFLRHILREYGYDLAK